ncbi:hypothetical protein [Streptomyces sp. NRRL S-1868]|uniref:hypothetical protein n=1 Tax=Streptomyces sp. NRRL S-1868 TaxID=1463892 RepID=UPI0004C51A73|nr:hypothetical protein [Streptomyces sp. NRRL S-1868]
MRSRYSLRDRALFQYVMRHPGRGAPYTVRSLAQAAGLSHHSLIGHLLSGARVDCDAETAHRIAEAVGVAVLVLFAPSPYPKQTEPDTKSHPLREEENT